MVNYSDPLVIQSDFLAVSKLWHSVSSIYLWEFVTTLDYEWSIIRGRRPNRWTIWLYSFTRIVAVVAVILEITGLDLPTPIGCEASTEFQLVCMATDALQLSFMFSPWQASAYLAFMAASLLIVLRVIAIFVVAIATSVWVTNVAFLIRGITQLRSIRVQAQTCVTVNTEGSKPSIVSVLVTDIVLISIMLFGLLRLGCYGGGTFRLGKLLWKQGVIWLLLAAIAEVPPTVFLKLNLNDAFNLMFQIPALIIMSIAATRMYRPLSDFVCGTGISESAWDSPKKGVFAVPKTSQGPLAPIQLNRTEVAVHTGFVQHPIVETTQTNYDSDGSCINIEAPLGDKPHRMVPCDIERGVGN